MAMTPNQTVRPWGLSRMAQPCSVAPLEYATITFDPETQLTHFHDAGGAIVDMQRGTVTTSQGGSDGSANSPKVADDSND